MTAPILRCFNEKTFFVCKQCYKFLKLKRRPPMNSELTPKTTKARVVLGAIRELLQCFSE